MKLGSSNNLVQKNTETSPTAPFYICSSEYAFIMEEVDIRAHVFKVFIPKLFPLMSKDSIIENSASYTNPTISSETSTTGPVKVKNYLTAENRTPFRNFHLGEVKNGDMEKSVGETEKETYIVPDIALPKSFCVFSQSPHVELPHYHPIEKPFEFYGMRYSELNDKTVPLGAKVVVEITSMMLDRIGVTWMPELVPLDYSQD